MSAGAFFQPISSLESAERMASTITRRAMIAGAAALLAIGFGILGAKVFHAAWQASSADMPTRVKALQARQGHLSRQLLQLERERDEATNRLVAMTEENARLASGPTQVELLKLRRQVASLRQTLAAAQSTGPSSSGGFLSQAENDPALKSIMHQCLQQPAQTLFGPLFHELKLNPEQTQKAVQLIADAEFKRDETLYSLGPGTISREKIVEVTEASLADLCEQLEPLIGEKGVARLREFREAMPAEATVTLLNGRLGASQLSPEQTSRLLEIVKAERFDLTLGISGTMDPAFVGTQEDIDNHTLEIAESNQRTLQQAGSFLSAGQLSALSMVLSNGIGDRILSAALYFGKH